MSAKKSDNANVTRIKAGASTKKSKVSVETTRVDKKNTPKKTRQLKLRAPKPLATIGGYFKGSWVELKQVRWPTRQATWGLTGAVLLFSAFFVVLILLLDAGFKLLFEKILG